jgi:hypothetical protein
VSKALLIALAAAIAAVMPWNPAVAGANLNGVVLNGASLNSRAIGSEASEEAEAEPGALSLQVVRLPDGRMLHVSAE